MWRWEPDVGKSRLLLLEINLRFLPSKTGALTTGRLRGSFMKPLGLVLIVRTSDACAPTNGKNADEQLPRVLLWNWERLRFERFGHKSERNCPDQPGGSQAPSPSLSDRRLRSALAFRAVMDVKGKGGFSHRANKCANSPLQNRPRAISIQVMARPKPTEPAMHGVFTTSDCWGIVSKP